MRQLPVYYLRFSHLLVCSLFLFLFFSFPYFYPWCLSSKVPTVAPEFPQTTCRRLSPHPHRSLSVCLSFPLSPIPLFLLSSTAPSCRKPCLPENKFWRVEGDKADEGLYARRGQQRMFLSFLWPAWLLQAALSSILRKLALRHPDQALGPTRAAWQDRSDAVTPVLHQPLTHGTYKSYVHSNCGKHCLLIHCTLN